MRVRTLALASGFHPNKAPVVALNAARFRRVRSPGPPGVTPAGRTALKLRRLPLCEVERPPERLRELRVTVSSLRLDGVLSAAFHVSRADAAQAVNAGRVAVNGAVCVKPDRQLAPQDVLALRGKGKLRILFLDGETKKGRQAVTVGIYE